MTVLATAILLLMGAAAPAAAADRPPRPHVESHNVETRAAYALPDRFRTTKRVPVHPGELLNINTRRAARRVTLDLDCTHTRVARIGARRFAVEITGGGCTGGMLRVRYPHSKAAYTFSLADHRHCAPKKSVMVAENEFVRVYSVAGVVQDERIERREDVFFACRLDSDKTVEIGLDYCGDAYEACYYIENVRIAGEKVAYVIGRDGDRYGRWRLNLNVLDTAVWTTQLQFGEDKWDGSGVGYIRVHDIALKDSGSIAWITKLLGYNGTAKPYPYRWETYEVRKNDASGRNVLLDSSPDIDPESLELTGSTLSWSANGELRAATLD